MNLQLVLHAHSFHLTFLDQFLTSYTQNGILHMLDRNRRIKSRPERFQDTEEQFDVIFTVEERIYDSVVEGSYNVLEDYGQQLCMLSSQLSKHGWAL